MPTNKNNRLKITSIRGLSVATVAMLGIASVQVVPQSPIAAIANAAVISPNDAQSWIDANADAPVPGTSGLYNDTLPAATASDSNLLTKEQPSVGNLGKAYTWGSSKLDDSSLTQNFPTDEYTYNGVTYGTFVYNIAALAQAKYGASLTDGQVVKTDEFPGLIPGIEYQVYTDGVSNYYQRTGVSSPLQGDVRNDAEITIADVGRYVFAAPLGDTNTYVQPNAYNEIQIKFYPNLNYIGEPPALPIYIMQDDGSGNLVKAVKTLKTVAPNKWGGAKYNSTGFDGKKQFALDRRGGLVSGNGFFSLTHKLGDDNGWVKFDPQPYLLLDPKAPAGTVGVSTLKKDNGTYTVEADGSVSFMPDANFKDVGTYNTALEGVVIVTSQMYTFGNNIGDSFTPNTDKKAAYLLPESNPLRSWTRVTYQPTVKPVTVEVSNLSAYGKMGSPITGTPDFSQDDGMPALDVATLSFVDGPTGAYPATAQKTKVVPGEGTWTISDTGAFTFTPEKGFAGHPTPVYYKAKNTGGVVSADDGDNTDGRFGTGMVTFTYSDASGLTANTFGKQGQTQSSFTKLPEYQDPGNVFNQANGHGVIFRNIPTDWYDDDFFRLIDADGNLATEVTVDGQGTYTIDVKTGEVTFTPVPTFVGTANPARITIAAEDYRKTDVKDADGFPQQPAPISTYTPTVEQGNIQVLNEYAVGNVGQTVKMTPEYTQPDGWSPLKLDTVSFLDENGKYPATPILSKTVDGEGTWTIDPATGEFTFTPAPGFAGNPTPQQYSAQNEQGLVAKPATVSAVYGGVVALPSTTVGLQNTVQYSDDDDASDNGLTRDEMFPDLPSTWFTNNGGPLTTTLVDANGNQVDSVTVPNQGTYTIDKDTGKVTFKPLETFVGKADPVTIAVVGLDGYTKPVQTSYTPFVTKDGTVLPNQYETAETVGKPWSATPPYTANGYNIDPTSVTFPDGSRTQVVDGEGTWTINPQTGEFTFTPEVGFNGSPTPVTYDGVNKENGLKATGGQVSITYPVPVTMPATTAAEQGVTQISTDTGDQDAGLTPAQMFPTVPKEWYGNEGDPVQFFLKDADGNNVTTLTVSTKDQETGAPIEAGTYTIDPVTGIVTFKPNPEFLGAAPAATIVTTGLSENLSTEYTPYYYPARVELPSDRQIQETLGAPTSSKFVDSQWNTKDFQVDKDSISILDANGNEVGKEYVVPGEGTWTVTLVGDKPAEGPDTREVIFTFTPEKGFIGQPTELEYTATNTNGVHSNTPGQVVFVYPTPEPQDAITTAKQGVVQNSDDKDAGDQGLTVEEMFPRIKEVPADWNLTYQIDGATDNKLVIDGQGTYEIDPATGNVTFTPEPDFVGTAKPATIVVYADGKPTAGKAKYTAVVEAFGDPEYHQVVVNTGETKTSPVTPPADAPEGAPKYSLPADWTAPEGWTVTIDENTGEVTAVAPTDESKMVAFEVPVTATYPGDVVRETVAPFSPLKGNMGSPEYKQVVVATGATETSPVTPPSDAPAGDPKYVIDPSFTAPEGWTVSIDEKTGTVTAVAPNNADQMVAFEVPVTATYPNNEVRTTTAPFSPLKTDFPAPDYNQVVVGTGATETSKVTPAPNAPAGDVKYAIDPSWTAPAGWTVTIAEDGTVTAVAPNNAEQMVAFEVPVTATYSDGQTRKTSAPFSPKVGYFGSPEYKQVVVDQGATEDSKVTPPADAPDGAPKYAIQEGWTAPEGWTVTIAEDGTVTAVAPNNADQMVAFEVPVIATYPAGEIRTTTAPFSPLKKPVDPETPPGEQTRPVPFKTEIVYDDTMDAGTSEVLTEGKLGEETFQNGQWNQTTEPVTQVIRVGTKAKVGTDAITWTEPIPFEVITRENPDLKPGEWREVQEGENGEKTHTMPITVDANGNPVPGETTTEITKQPVNKIIEIGPGVDDEIKDEHKEPIPFETEIIFDPTLEPGQSVEDQAGVMGEKTITTTIKIVDGKAQEPVVTEEVTKEPVKRIIRVGAKLPDNTEVIPFETEVKYDSTLKPGESKIITPGKPGVKTLIDGEWVVTTEPVNAVVAVGPIEAGQEVVKWTDPVPFETEVRVNPDLAPGEQREVQAGVEGEDTTTVIVSWDTEGNSSQTEPETVRTKEPVKRIIEVGPGATNPVVVEVITEQPYPTEIVYDPNLPAGESVVDQEGKVGQTRIIITQLVDENGNPIGDPVRTEEKISDPEKQIIRVGTGCPCKPVDPPVLETRPIEPGSKVIERPDIPEGVEVKVPGTPGEETLIDGKWVVTKEPQDEVIYKGTKKDEPKDPQDPVVPPSTNSSDNETFQRCIANAKSSPLLWLVPVGLLGVIGNEVAKPYMGDIQASLGRMNVQLQDQLGIRKMLEDIDRTRDNFGSGGAGRTFRNPFQKEFEAYNKLVGQLRMNWANATRGLPQFNTEQTRIAAGVIGAGMAVAMLTAYWCSDTPEQVRGQLTNGSSE